MSTDGLPEEMKVVVRQIKAIKDVCAAAVAPIKHEMSDLIGCLDHSQLYMHRIRELQREYEAAVLVPCRKIAKLESRLDKLVAPTARLRDAAKAGNLNNAMVALREGAYIDLGMTYIPDEHDKWDNLLAHDTLLPFRLRTFARSEDGRTALFFACRCGHTAMCNYLLEKGASPTTLLPSTGTTRSVLTEACHWEHTELVQALLDRGFDPNSADSDDAGGPLGLAAGSTNTALLSVLLHSGADPNQVGRDVAGLTQPAILYASECGQLANMQLLVAFGADLNAAGSTVREIAGLGSVGMDMHDPQVRPKILAWLNAVDGWSPFRVAVGCRLHRCAKAALRLGLIDPSSAVLADVIATAESPAGMLWADSPAPDSETSALMRRAMARWGPARHSLYHRGVRGAVRTTMLVAQRLRCRGGAAAIILAAPAGLLQLPVLPPELWGMVCSFFLRRNFTSDAAVAWPELQPKRPTPIVPGSGANLGQLSVY